MFDFASSSSSWSILTLKIVLADVVSYVTYGRGLIGPGGGGAYSYVLHALVVRPLTTRPREDGALFPQDRSPMANRSFLLCQRWLKKVFPSLSILSISLPAFSAHFLCPSMRERDGGVNDDLVLGCLFLDPNPNTRHVLIRGETHVL